MSKWKLVVGAVAAAVLVVTGVQSVQAANVDNTRVSETGAVTLAKDQTHEGSFYAAGESVRIEGTVNGDVYCAGSMVEVSGTVNGDVLCAAEKITIRGDVNGDVRAAAADIDVLSRIDGDFSAFGQSVELRDSSVITGDVNGAAQALTLQGVIEENVVYAAQSLDLTGTINGDAEVAVEQLDIRNDGTIAGDLRYLAETNQSVNSSDVGGTVSYSESGTEGSNFSTLVMAAVGFMLTLVFSGLLVALLAPRFVDRSSVLARKNFLSTTLYGLGVLLWLPILAVVMLFTVLLLPIGIALLLMWGTILLLSGVFFSYFLGSLLLHSQKNILLRMVSGAITLALLCMLPYVGGFVLFVAIILGSGMVVRTILHGYRKPQYGISRADTNDDIKSSKKK